MIKIENVEVTGWEHVIRGMRNPKNSWDKSDSSFCVYSDYTPDCADCSYVNICCCNDKDMYTKYIIGSNDHELMMRLAKGGSVHAKYRRMIAVYMDITAPLYWWKEFDTYKIGTVANSCSTMHKITAKEFTLEDFSHEKLCSESLDGMIYIINLLNAYRNAYINWDKNDVQPKKDYWWQLIQLLPSSYNQKRTVMLNYEVLAGLYPMRKEHKLDEWRKFCQWIEQLPYSEIIIVKEED
ncbi:MAG: hypothetical protein K2K70_10740 [Lachnospiraceae bacterium]|nr:hypothetical protein [Lachnospiraceae bacterium]